MILPRGITGFWKFGEDGPPFCDLRAFRGHCYEVARLMNSQVRSTAHALETRMARNYVYVLLEMPARSVAVLLNAHFPWLAFAEPPDEGQCGFAFIDIPELASCFSNLNVYRILDIKELGQRAVSECYQDLSKAELRRIKYFEPTTLGEIIFNYWD